MFAKTIVHLFPMVKIKHIVAGDKMSGGNFLVIGGSRLKTFNRSEHDTAMGGNKHTKV